MNEPATSNAITKATAAATYGGASSAVLFGLTANEIAAYGGLAIGLIGLLLNQAVTIYFKRRHLRVIESAAQTRPDCATCPERNI